ncbi:MAG TPA: hypothetical protein OIL86_13915 [Eggerthellaceae bacterium]|nr:hypothetical protein [Eggerthellaceae bacterium]
MTVLRAWLAVLLEYDARIFVVEEEDVVGAGILERDNPRDSRWSGI